MPELSPRRQKSGRCGECRGPIRFYPRPVSTEHLDNDVEGEWVHVNPADWIGNPHTPKPEE